MVKTFCKIPNFNFCQKWVWLCHAPRGDPTSLKNNLKFFIDQKLLDGERIFLETKL